MNIKHCAIFKLYTFHMTQCTVFIQKDKRSLLQNNLVFEAPVEIFMRQDDRVSNDDL